MRSAQCDRSRLWVSLRLDAALSELEAALLDKHLRGCADCRLFSSDTLALTNLLRSAEVEVVEAPVGVPGRPRLRRVLGVQAVTAFAVAASVVLIIFSAGGTRVPSIGGGQPVSTATSTLRPVSLERTALAFRGGAQQDTLGVPRFPLRLAPTDGGVVRGMNGTLL